VVPQPTRSLADRQPEASPGQADTCR